MLILKIIYYNLNIFFTPWSDADFKDNLQNISLPSGWRLTRIINGTFPHFLVACWLKIVFWTFSSLCGGMLIIKHYKRNIFSLSGHMLIKYYQLNIFLPSNRLYIQTGVKRMVSTEIINNLWCASDGILMSINETALLFYGALLLHEEALKRKAL